MEGQLQFFMAALWNRADHYIFALWFLNVYHTSTHGVALMQIKNAGLKLMCYTRLAGNAGPKKSPKIRHLGTITQLCQATSSQRKHVLTIGKIVLNSNISSTCPPQYDELRSTSG